MNKRQLWVLWFGIIIIVAMLLFPPVTMRLGDKVYEQGYRFIFKPGPGWLPDPDDKFLGLPYKDCHLNFGIDLGRLLPPIAAVLLVGIGLFSTFKERKK